MKVRRKKHRGAEVSTHSLNDIMFFLLLFFIIISTMAVKYTQIKISVPSTKGAPNDYKKDAKISIEVDANKDYYINEQPIKYEDIERRLQEEKTKNPEILVELSIDKELTVQDLVDIMQLGAKMDLKMYLNTLKD